MLLEVQLKEVKKVLFNMHPDKFPRPDGISPVSIKNTGMWWANDYSIAQAYLSLTQKFFLTGKLDHNITDTNIILIPKKQDPSYMTDLRHISLCNIMY